MGNIPWKGLGPVEIRDILLDGERLGRPERCPADVFDLIQRCWQANPQDRPTFAQIYNQVQQVTESESYGTRQLWWYH